MSNIFGVCVRVCVFVCVHACVRACVRACVHVRVCVKTYTVCEAYKIFMKPLSVLTYVSPTLVLL